MKSTSEQEIVARALDDQEVITGFPLLLINAKDSLIREWEVLLASKDRIIGQQEEQIGLLAVLAETRRLNLMAQSQELAEHRQFEESRNHPWQFFWWLLLRNVWPFSVWYHRFD